MKLTKKCVQSLYKIYSDYGAGENVYGETLAELHDIWQEFAKNDIETLDTGYSFWSKKEKKED